MYVLLSLFEYDSDHIQFLVISFPIFGRFPEGTRFSKKKLLEGQEFAEKRGLTKLSHLYVLSLPLYTYICPCSHIVSRNVFQNEHEVVASLVCIISLQPRVKGFSFLTRNLHESLDAVVDAV